MPGPNWHEHISHAHAFSSAEVVAYGKVMFSQMDNEGGRTEADIGSNARGGVQDG